MIIKPSRKFFGRRYPIRPREGELIELVVLKYPDLINWLAEKDAPHGSEWLPEYIVKCTDAFDAKPFTKMCAGRSDGGNCTNLATRFSLYPNSAEPMFWCATCDPSQLGAFNLAVSSRYYDALFHVSAFEGTRPQYRNLIKAIAKAKGYTGSFTETKVIQFFYGPAAKPRPQVDEDGV